jgi:hypothetical protein
MADLNFLNLTDCDAITFNTPTTDFQFIEYITGSVVKDFSNVDKYTITYSNNCCSPGVTTNVAPRYQFVLSEACVFGTPTVGFDAYAIQVDGINGNLVQSITLLNDGVPASGWSYTVVGDVLSVNDVQISGAYAVPVVYIMTITTLSGFVYVINFTITKAGVACDGVLATTSIVYPTLPANVLEVVTALPNEELSFNTLISSVTISPGVYEIIFCEVNEDLSSTCIQNYIFIDCGTLKCQVVNKWVLCIDSNIMDFYNALNWGNACTDTLTYLEMCALYEILTIILESDNCYGMLDDCNCMSASSIANTLSPVTYPKSTNTNPCSTC